MKFVLFLCLVGLATARPQDDVALTVTDDTGDSVEGDLAVSLVEPLEAVAQIVPDVRSNSGDGNLAAVSLINPLIDGAQIVTDERSDSGDGNFNYNFETSDGTRVSAVGTPGAAGTASITGEYSYLLSDGTVVLVRYIANENGFQPVSDWLPTPHPLPAHAIEQLRVAEEQRAAGITFE